MSQLPSVSAKEVLRALHKAGFFVARTKGSHRILAHHDDPTRMVTVPYHGSRDLKPGTLRNILKQAGLTAQQFRDLL